MDLSKVTDVEKLKALAYDQLVAKEFAEANLRALNTRIAEIKEESERQENNPEETKEKKS